MQEPVSFNWYFDFISPFSYLQWQLLQRETLPASLRPVPLLFAGLLKHWDNKGPVEVAPKRSWTYAHCLWIAKRHGIVMQLPAQHPFNPLPLLRLCIACECKPAAINRLFRYVWQDGHIPTDTHAWAALMHELALDPAALESPEVKETLRKNGETAIAEGVFGVPSAVVDGRLFWGVDATDMLLAYLQGDPFFSGIDMQRALDLPSGAQRPIRT